MGAPLDNAADCLFGKSKEYLALFFYVHFRTNHTVLMGRQVSKRRPKPLLAS